MKTQKRIKQSLMIGLIILMGSFLTGGACEDSPVGDLAEQCGITCSEKGIADGNASISGFASIDGFFAAVVNFDQRATKISADIDAELAAIAASLDMAGGAQADFAGSFQSAVAAKFNLDATAGVTVDFQPPKCEVSASASIEATAKCDATVDAGSVEASCSGKCEVDPGEVNLEAACEGSVEAELTCTGTAPSLSCEGTCTGSCELEVAASCEGTCNGTCDGTCSVENTDGSCSGQCDGNCEGSCELEAGGSCDGKCTGSCEYTPPSGSCEGGAKAEISCKAEANAEPPEVNCSGSCSGEVTPPSASAECEASAKAEAEVNAECHPPSVAVSYQFDATAMGALDADAQATMKAEFKAWLTGFKAHIAAIAAASAQADIVAEAGKGIISAASNVVGDAAGEVAAEAGFSGTIKLACASKQLQAVPGVINGATSELTASVTAAASLTTALGK